MAVLWLLLVLAAVVSAEEDCNIACTDNYDPVCGDDGLTYPNLCSLDAHNCETNSNVQVDHMGECGQKATSKKECNMKCPLNYLPVCGDDSKTYPNQCTLDAYNCVTDSNVQMAYQGECKECNVVCPANYDPVCGTDGETYPNQCAMDVHNCQTNSNVQVDHMGECKPKECYAGCPYNLVPLCGDDGITYPNQCVLDFYNCITDSNVQVAYPGECNECNFGCAAIYAPVCGTDGETYPSQCSLDGHNCQTNSNVQVDHQGECGQKVASKKECNMVCPLNYLPVCGDDGKTYPNQCTLDGYNCETDSNVQVDHHGECGQKVASKKECDMMCPLNYLPVCGDDGKTYPNQCTLDGYKCETDSNVQVAYPGECKDCNLPCPLNYDPVCGTDGETYPNQCALDVHNCQTNSNVEVDHKGKCGQKAALKMECNIMCPLNYQPVCGDDGKTYPNQCTLDGYNCMTDCNVNMAYPGECKDCNLVCPANYDPVCGTDGETYPNQCTMDVHNCQTNSNVEVDHMGECGQKAALKECNMLCPMNYLPVCGDDGKTYPNQCALDSYNCMTDSNVQVDHVGKCQKKAALKEECLMRCPKLLAPVCGIDGVTYPNQCMLDVHNCETRSKVIVAYGGKCDENCIVPCPNYYDPVCGTDGVTYSNPCELGAHNCYANPIVQVAHMGTCEEKLALKGECDTICPANYQPVCGTDGLTYGNQCMLDVYNCVSSSNVLVAYEGECDEECSVPCPNCYDPVCGTDGVTYSNPCQLGMHNCHTNSDVQVDHMGTCEEKVALKGECDIICPANYQPVCGTDGHTYSNQCVLEVHNCVTSSNVLVAYEGECNEECNIVCPNCYDPVCGTDGVTYPNPCELGAHNCHTNSDVQVDHPGECEQ